MVSGILGKKNLRAKNTPMTEGIPKMMIVLISTNLCFILEIIPAILLNPTIHKE